VTNCDPYVMRQVSCQASLLVANAGFKAQDWEDVRQELLLDLLRRAPRFDAARGDWQGFVRGIARNHATVLIARRRRRALEVLLADAVNGDDNLVDAARTVDSGGGRHGAAQLNLSLDVRTVVASLPPHVQTVALLLAEMSVKEACARTGRSRSGLYLVVRQLREAFALAGLAPPKHHRRSRVRNATPEPAK
jgi:RNA polymerase sigma-70 factor (ECF subfamily)